MDTRSVASAAQQASRMMHDGEPLKDIWRFSLLQLLDDYESRARHQGAIEAATLFTTAPHYTGDSRIDAAFAALAEHLARRDGWRVPVWAANNARATIDWWFVSELRGMHPTALRESPLSFRKRGVFITSKALERV